MDKFIWLFLFCLGICLVWAWRSGKECIEAGDDQEPLYDVKPSLREMIEAHLETSGMKARMTSDEISSFVMHVHKLIITEKKKSYDEGSELTAKALGFVCPPPSVKDRCINDTDGDGNCSYCIENPNGCHHKK